MADALCSRVQATRRGVNRDWLLEDIHVFRARDHTEQLALMYTLPTFLQQHGRVRLVVVDSAAFHFRHDFDNWALRSRLLHGMAQSLLRMALEHSLAVRPCSCAQVNRTLIAGTVLQVVLMNQMTTRVMGDQSYLVPALGESWGHVSTHRIVLYWRDGVRRAQLLKSPKLVERTVAYAVTVRRPRSCALLARRPC
jgi:RAD51-like protein 2